MDTFALHGNVPRRFYWLALHHDQQAHGETAYKDEAAYYPEGNLESSVWEDTPIKGQDRQFDRCDRGIVQHLGCNYPLILKLTSVRPCLVLLTYFSESLWIL